jgi:hypothetical protein
MVLNVIFDRSSDPKQYVHEQQENGDENADR